MGILKELLPLFIQHIFWVWRIGRVLYTIEFATLVEECGMEGVCSYKNEMSVLHSKDNCV